MLSRAGQKDSIDEAIAMARKIVAEKNAFSDVARSAQYYVGELLFLKKDFSAAAAEFKRFVKMYGPPQDQAGNVANAPWRPAAVDDRTLQVYDAALRVAHSWYLQGHHQNMIQAYQWIVTNLPHQNKNLAEAHYWLAMELARSADKDKAEKKRQVAEALWKNVVHPGYDFGSAGFAKRYHFWVRDPSPSVQQYVQLAALRAGQLLGEAGDHELAAGIFQEYMDLFGSPAGGGRKSKGPAQAPSEGAEDNLSIARYALGRELLAMDEVTKAITCYQAYLYDLREDRFRVAGLKALAFYAAREKDYDLAAEAYATLLEEYGPNERDLMGRPVPVASKDRIRQGGSRVTAGGRRIAGKSGNWDGVRLPAPAGLDLGDVRHNLGYLYWKQQDWSRCVKVLAPFLEDEPLRKGRSAPKALYMAAQSCFRMCDYAGGMKFLRPLLRDYPSFEAVEEAHVYAARGCVETAQWAELDHLCRRFAEAWPQSSHRPHMDLYAAVALAAQGKTDGGLARLKGLAAADTLEDVKADASYHVGRLILADEKAPNYAEAMKYLDQSVALYPREAALLAAARCAMKLRQPEKAKAALDRLLREFAGGDPKVVAEAKALLGEVNKQVPLK